MRTRYGRVAQPRGLVRRGLVRLRHVAVDVKVAAVGRAKRHMSIERRWAGRARMQRSATVGRLRLRAVASEVLVPYLCEGSVMCIPSKSLVRMIWQPSREVAVRPAASSSMSSSSSVASSSRSNVSSSTCESQRVRAGQPEATRARAWMHSRR